MIPVGRSSTLRGRGLFLGDDRNRFPLRSPKKLDFGRTADPLLGENPVEIVDARDLLAREAEEEIALPNSRARRRAVCHHLDHEHRLRLRDVVEPAEAGDQGNVLTPHPDLASPNPSVLDQAPRDVLDGVARDREADSLGAQDDRGREPDYGPRRRDERPSGVAGVQSGIRLNDSLDEPSRYRPERAAESAHHPRGHGALESERVSDGDDELPDFQMSGVTEARGPQLR